MIKITEPDFPNAQRFLEHIEQWDPTPILNRYGAIGVARLSSATPVDSGETANSWDYQVKRSGNKYKLIWTNSAMAGRAPLALMLQYGHGTKNGFFLSGRDYINPALYPVYDELHDALVEEALRI